VRHRFGIQQVVWVGDRGMITNTRILAEFQPVEGLDWITALRAPQIRKLVEQEAVQLSLFDETDLVEFSCSDYPDERLIACRNPMLAQEKSLTREALLQATEQELHKIVIATSRDKRALKGADQIGLRVGRVLNSKGVGKYFNIAITEESFSFSRNEVAIAKDSALDGVYIIRTSVKPETLDAAQKTSEKLPVHSFRTLMADLATIVKNKFQSNGLEASLTFEKITQSTPLQQKAIDLLEVSLICTQ
jgi:hypothetical protein